MFLRIFSGDSLIAERVKSSDVEGRGCADVNVGVLEVEVLITLMKLKDMSNHNFFNSTSLCSRDCKLKTWGV